MQSRCQTPLGSLQTTVPSNYHLRQGHDRTSTLQHNVADDLRSINCDVTSISGMTKSCFFNLVDTLDRFMFSIYIHSLVYPIHSFTGSIPLFTPIKFYRKYSLAYPIHSFTGSIPLFTPSAVLQEVFPCLPYPQSYRKHSVVYPHQVLHEAFPCLPYPQFYWKYSLVYPIHSFTGSIPLFTPSTVLQEVFPCLPHPQFYRKHSLVYPIHSFT